MTPSEALDEAWDRGCRGVTDAGELATHVAADPAAARAWELARAALAVHHGRGVDAPPSAAFATLRGASALSRAIGSLGLAMVARAAFVRLDATATYAALEEMRALDPATASPRAALWLEVTELFHGGPTVDARAPRTEAIVSRATAARFAELVVEGTALRVMLAFEEDDSSRAVELARRLCRKARAEAIRPQEYLASMLLARARRASGMPHLATRIARAVAAVAPQCWRPWIDWELCLAGELDGAAPEGTAPFSSAAALRALLSATFDGDLGRVAAARRTLEARTRGHPLAGREADVLRAALDPGLAVDAMPPSVSAWAAGRSEALPLGLRGVVGGIASPHVELAGNSWVLVRPDAPARRVLHPAIGLVSELPRFERTARLHGRTETAAAVLALAGEAGAPVAEFVRRVYGFPYVRDSHDGMLRVLLHRLRQGLEGVARVAAIDDRVVMTPARAFLVPDPRTSTPTEDRVLRMIGAARAVSAREIASALAMPLRTVQAVLHQLVDDGACLASRNGAAVEYTIEDTTFSDPTTSSSGKPMQPT